LHDFVAGLIHLRRTCRALRRERFFTGTTLKDGSRKDIMWLRLDGTEMHEGDWFDASRREIGMCFGDEDPLPGDPLMLIFLNAHDAELRLVLPPHPGGWDLYIDTAGDPGGNVFDPVPAGPTHALRPRSLVLFRSRAVPAS